MKKGVKCGLKTQIMFVLLAVLFGSLGYLYFQGGKEGFKEGNTSLTKGEIDNVIKLLKNSKRIITKKNPNIDTSNIDNAVSELEKVDISGNILPATKKNIETQIKTTIKFFNENGQKTPPNLTAALNIISEAK